MFIRHGGILVRVHQSRLSKVNVPDEDKQLMQNAPVNSTENENTVHNDVSENSDDEKSVNGEEQISDINVRENLRQTNVIPETESNVTADLKLKTGQRVMFTNRVDGVQHTARVLGRAGKAKGKYKGWYNVQYLEPYGSEGQKQALDMSHVDNLHIESENIKQQS